MATGDISRVAAGRTSAFGRGAESAADVFREAGRAGVRTFDDVERAQFRGALYTARNGLWHQPALQDPARGHFHSYRADGEPGIPDGLHYRPVPLVMPADTTRLTSVQGPWGNCYVVAGMNALGKKEPDSLLMMVSKSGEKVVVRNHLGTYRMNATLPYTAEGKPTYATMPGGSTLAAYIEKAAAAHFGSYQAVESGNAAGFLYWAVGDRYPEANIVDVRTMAVDEIRDVIESSRPAAVNIVPPERRDDIPANLAEHNLVKMHVYVPEDLDREGNMILKNPWGREDSVGMNLQILQRMNASLHWVDVRPT